MCISFNLKARVFLFTFVTCEKCVFYMLLYLFVKFLPGYICNMLNIGYNCQLFKNVDWVYYQAESASSFVGSLSTLATGQLN